MKKGKMSRRRRAIGPNNPLIPAQYQGRQYRIDVLMLQPRVTILSEDGSTETEFLTQPLAWYKSGWGKTVAEYLASVGLAQESSK